jgi:hypothetical protein
MIGEFIMLRPNYENLMPNTNFRVSDMFPPDKIYKCVICGYKGPKEDFTSTVEGKELCKIRGHWTCVRDYYKYVFYKYQNEAKKSGLEIREFLNKINSKAHKEMLDIIKEKKGDKNVADNRINNKDNDIHNICC